jgi:hypothetical protein
VVALQVSILGRLADHSANMLFLGQTIKAVRQYRQRSRRDIAYALNLQKRT